MRVKQAVYEAIRQVNTFICGKIGNISYFSTDKCIFVKTKGDEKKNL
jgi:hypothetical protein